MSDSSQAATFGYVTEQLDRLGIGYFHVIEPRIKGIELVAQGQAPIAGRYLRPKFSRALIAAGGFTKDTAEAVLAADDADLTAFGRHFISNPDLPERFRRGVPLNPYDRRTFYGGDGRRYTDYPAYDLAGAACALNLTTGAAYTQLSAMPMVMITGQKGVLSRKQARFQVVDIVSTTAPLTKMARQIVSPATIPSIVRDAFRVAQQERPAPVHLELPEDIAAEQAPEIRPVPRHLIALPAADRAALDRAAEMILAAERPLTMLGAAASRPRLADALSDFVRRLQVPFFNTQMGKGAVAGGSGLYLGKPRSPSGTNVHRAIDRADLIIAIGHDTVEKPPFLMGPRGPRVLHVGFLPVTVEEVYFPSAELIGDVGPSLTLLADRLEGKLSRAGALLPLREQILARISERAEESRYPLTPQRIVHDVRQVMWKTGSSAWTMACARSGSPATTAPVSRTRSYWTTRSRRWGPGCPRPSWPPCSIRADACSPYAVTAGS
jgi:hypothetical protein